MQHRSACTPQEPAEDFDKTRRLVVLAVQLDMRAMLSTNVHAQADALFA